MKMTAEQKLKEIRKLLKNVWGTTRDDRDRIAAVLDLTEEK